MDAIARFEIALRTQFAYQLAHRHGSWAYEDPNLFVNATQHTGRIASAHHLTTVRNTCAHHGRLWNRCFTVTTKLPKTADESLIATLEPRQPDKLYNTLTLLAFCLICISDDNRWRGQLIELVNQYPTINTTAMEFPDDWRQRPLWSD